MSGRKKTEKVPLCFQTSYTSFMKLALRPSKVLETQQNLKLIRIQSNLTSSRLKISLKNETTLNSCFDFFANFTLVLLQKTSIKSAWMCTWSCFNTSNKDGLNLTQICNIIFDGKFQSSKNIDASLKVIEKINTLSSLLD